MSIRVIVVDDQPLVRGGLRMIIDATEDIEMVGEADNGRAAVECAERVPADVVLMDVEMPFMDGLEATRRILALPDPPRVLVLTTFDLEDYIFGALEAGASGFLLKDAKPDDLIAGIRTVAAGEALLAPTITTRLVAQFRDRRPLRPVPAEMDLLTPREHQIFLFLAQGRSNAQIAGELTLSRATVKTHVTRILTKLSLVDRAQAVVLGYETGLIRPGEGAG